MAVSFTTVAFTVARLAAAVVVSGVILTAAVFPAMAQSSQTVSIAVSTEGLNLAQPAGQAALRHRLAVAAHKVCRETDAPGPDDSNAFTDCTSTAMHEAWKTGAELIAQAQSRSELAAN